VAVWNALIKFNMAQYEVDGDGFLKDPDIWSKTVAETFAQEDGISELTEDHWKVIDVIREHYLENGNAPMVRKICKSTGLKLKEIYELFPLGPARGACRVAGLPKPDGCV
jgi:TusE/DsrC/DsvC family sulfur relay protein